jgi:hypothetical protein
VRLPEGTFTASLVGGRVTYTFTPRMFVAALSQYNSTVNGVGTNVRLRWEYIPGSEFFVVYSDAYDTSPGLILRNRGLVVKVNRLLRF